MLFLFYMHRYMNFRTLHNTISKSDVLETATVS